MKKRIGAWKRKKDKDATLVQSQESGQSHSGVIGSTAPMHFHFSNAKCSFVMDQPEPICDLTLTSTSTASGTKSWHTETNSKLSASRKSIDAPGWQGNESHGEPQNSVVRRRAQILSPSRVLICHAPAPEWPPKATSFDSRNATPLYGSPFCGSLESGRESAYGKSPIVRPNQRVVFCNGPSYGDKENNVGKSPNLYQSQHTKNDHKTVLSSSRILLSHGPNPELPPAKPSQYHMVNHHGAKGRTRPLPLPTHNQSRFHNNPKNISRSSTSSDPPVDFNLPRKEIVDAIKCHEKLGRALSKLALNTEINDPNLVGAQSFTSTTLTDPSTFESFSANSFRENQEPGRLGAMVKQEGQQRVTRDRPRNVVQRSNHVHRTVQPVENCTNSTALSNSQYIIGVVNESSFPSEGLQAEFPGSWSSLDGIQWSGSGCSQSNISAKSETSFSQHVAFIEGLEDHIKRFSPEETSADHVAASPSVKATSEADSQASFFPSLDELRSPPPSTASQQVPNPPALNEMVHPSLPLLKTKNQQLDVRFLSPPCTPASMYAFSTMQPQPYHYSIDGEEILQGIEQIKKETATMLDGFESKLKSDLRDLIVKEVGQFKSIVSEKNKTEPPTSTTPPGPVQKTPSSTFSQLWSQFSPPINSTTQHTMTPQPHRNATPPSIDCHVLSEVLQKSLRSMEASILDKIKLHMDEDALQQRAFIEEIIDEKVTKVMAGQNLELQMAMDEVARTVKEAVRRTSFDFRSPDRCNPVITPARNLSPIRPSLSDKRMSMAIDVEPISPSVRREKSIRVLEDSFADAERVIDDFVADMDDIVSDFDKIAFRMDSSGAESDFCIAE